MEKREPVHIEVTSSNGATKWVRDIVSHSCQDIIDAWSNGEETIVVKDGDGAETAIDLDDTFMIRLQNEEVFQRRSQFVRKK